MNTKVPYKTPIFEENAFNCPFCNAYAHMKWHNLLQENRGQSFYCEAFCEKCQEPSLWRVTEFIPATNQNNHYRTNKNGEMLYPDNGYTALPEQDMPIDVKNDYIEAARIISKSPRSAAALLRLALQKLCKHLGQDGKNINQDIRSLAVNNTLPPLVIKVADTVRITGNNAVHPGEMSNEDIDFIASKMFGLLNFIVKKTISEPRELEALYALTPENPRKDAEKKDAKSRSK